MSRATLLERLRSVFKGLRTGRATRKLNRRRPQLETLEDRLAPAAAFIGASAGGPPLVKVLDEGGAIVRSIRAFGPSHGGGVNVAQGDVTGDGVPDLIAAKARGTPLVKVFDGATFRGIHSFLAYGRGYRGGVNVACGHLRNGETCDIITGQARGRAVVRVFDGSDFSLVRQIVAYGREVNGVRVAAGNLDTGTVSDVITGPGPGGEPIVKAFDARTGEQVLNLMAYDAAFEGGVQVAAGDFDNNAVHDIVTGPGPGGPGSVRVYASGPGNPLIREFFPYGNSYTGGVLVGAVDNAGQVPDEIAVARQPGRGVSKDLARTFMTTNLDGQPTGDTTVTGIGARGLKISSAAHRVFSSYSGPRWHAAAYNPTWPNWSAEPAAGKSTGDNSATTLNDTTKNWAPNVYAGQTVTIDGGPGSGQTQTIVSNTATQLTVSLGWTTVPTNDSTYVVPTTQLFDSDFFNDAFRGLWDRDGTGQGRQDLVTIQNAGFNLVRLYNWGPSRGAGSSAHLAFLDKVQELGLKVIVPVSDFFLNDDRFAWNRQNPDADFSFGSATADIQNDLNLFLISITKNGTLHPAVHSIAVGNEMDIGIDKDPGNTAKLQRALWWVKNLHDKFLEKFGQAPPLPFLSIPISNADQGNGGSDKSWFALFAHGVKAGEATPHGAVPGGAFTADVKGLETFDWYKSWFYNSLNLFQVREKLTNTLKQYDTGVATGPTWSDRWPGEKLDVPLLVTELGWTRFNLSEDRQFNIVAFDEAQFAQNYLKTASNIMGYTIFLLNDEPNKNNYVGPVNSEVLFGATKYYNTTNQNDFRNGTLLYTLETGTTPWAGGTLPSYTYPVFQLFSVTSGGGVTLLAQLKDIFNQG